MITSTAGRAPCGGAECIVLLASAGWNAGIDGMIFYSSFIPLQPNQGRLAVIGDDLHPLQLGIRGGGGGC